MSLRKGFLSSLADKVKAGMCEALLTHLTYCFGQLSDIYIYIYFFFFFLLSSRLKARGQTVSSTAGDFKGLRDRPQALQTCLSSWRRKGRTGFPKFQPQRREGVKSSEIPLFLGSSGFHPVKDTAAKKRKKIKETEMKGC